MELPSLHLHLKTEKLPSCTGAWNKTPQKGKNAKEKQNYFFASAKKRDQQLLVSKTNQKRRTETCRLNDKNKTWASTLACSKYTHSSSRREEQGWRNLQLIPLRKERFVWCNRTEQPRERRWLCVNLVMGIQPYQESAGASHCFLMWTIRREFASYLGSSLHNHKTLALKQQEQQDKIEILIESIDFRSWRH